MLEREISISEGRRVFNSRYPYADVEGLAFDRLPFLIRRSLRNERDCGLAFAAIHPDQSRTYVAQDLSTNNILVQDRNKRNIYTGDGYVVFDEQDGVPVVGFTFTSKRFREKGLGTRRLLVMDASARIFYGEPLASSITPRIAQRSIWERLVERQQAEMINSLADGYGRFQFIR